LEESEIKSYNILIFKEMSILKTRSYYCSNLELAIFELATPEEARVEAMPA